MKYKMDNAGTRMMLENKEGTARYEFFTRSINESNVSNKIAYYEPVVRCCQFLGNGSTYIDRRISVEEGNDLFQKLLAKGFIKVTKRTFA